LDRVDTALRGDGFQEPGLVGRVKALEDHRVRGSQSCSTRRILALVGAAIGGGIGIGVALAKAILAVSSP
jgi:hypothetical protein